MDRVTKKRLVRRLKQYRYIDNIIKQRRLVLLTPYKRDQEAVGGGKMQNVNNEAVANQAIKLSEDPLLNDLESHKKIIQDKLREADTITRAIIDDMYTLHGHTKVETALRNHVSEATVYHRTEKFLEELEPILLPMQ